MGAEQVSLLHNLIHICSFSCICIMAFRTKARRLAHFESVFHVSADMEIQPNGHEPQEQFEDAEEL
jgi:hypothetical protein